MVSTGLDLIQSLNFKPLVGKKIGVVCNQATVDSGLTHLLDVFLPGHRDGTYEIMAAFGPQHGIWGHTQDNMIEWEGYRDPRTGLNFHSLYGEHRKPTPEMMSGLELLVVDLPDIGSRYYTFMWTMAHCMEACLEHGVPMLVLDRPNPIGGVEVEGTVLDEKFVSFVGLHPLPMRHGLTLGELAQLFKTRHYPGVELEIVPVQNWSRDQLFAETGLPWVMPSPNMPTPDTALVYPGGCLLEATNLSEGRGTTRPFEMLGAPWIDGWALASALSKLNLPGIHFRPIAFLPTFHKFAGENCEGVGLHVTERTAFRPVLTMIAILQEIRRQCGAKLEWKAPPYEYVYDRDPIDILAGNAWLRQSIDTLEPLENVRERMHDECAQFLPALLGVRRY